MDSLDREDILKLARLARIDLTKEEVDEFSTELTEVLQYVERLQAVDVAGLKPTGQVSGLVNVMRDDVVKDYGYDSSELMKNVPDTLGGHIKVKRMIT